MKARETDVPRLDYWAYADWHEGHPRIRFGPEFYRQPRVVQEFSRLHECAHLAARTGDETRVNCIALNIMRIRGLSERDEAVIEAAHLQYATLGPQYGGSGREYWRRTIECAGPRR